MAENQNEDSGEIPQPGNNHENMMSDLVEALWVAENRYSRYKWDYTEIDMGDDDDKVPVIVDDGEMAPSGSESPNIPHIMGESGHRPVRPTPAGHGRTPEAASGKETRGLIQKKKEKVEKKIGETYEEKRKKRAKALLKKDEKRFIQDLFEDIQRGT